MIDTNSPEYLRRVDTLTKVIRSRIEAIDNDPDISIPSLLRLLVVFVASEFHGKYPNDIILMNWGSRFAQELAEVLTALGQIKATEQPTSGDGGKTLDGEPQ